MTHIITIIYARGYFNNFCRERTCNNNIFWLLKPDPNQVCGQGYPGQGSKANMRLGCAYIIL